MSDARQIEFGEKLADLVTEYRDVSGAVRSVKLFAAFVALCESAKGTQLTVRDVTRACANCTTRFVRMGVVRL